MCFNIFSISFFLYPHHRIQDLNLNGIRCVLFVWRQFPFKTPVSLLLHSCESLTWSINSVVLEMFYYCYVNLFMAL